VKGLVDLVNELEAQKVHFQSITDGIDTKTPAGRFFFHVMAGLAKMERELILERIRAGLESARPQGRVGGRKRWMTDSKVQAARKAIGKRDAAARRGAQLRGVDPHVISMGARRLADLRARDRRWTIHRETHRMNAELADAKA
jgi:DNA invertase Pin-like site-specific DNA recombinase